MPSCFVPRCRSGYAARNKELRQKGLPLPHFFSPSTEEQRSRWEHKIKRKDSPLTLKSRVCSEHFCPEYFDEYFEVKLKDGTISRIPRDRARLKSADVDPTIFKDYPIYLQENRTSRKPPTKRQTPKKRNVIVCQQQLEESQAKDDTTVHEYIQPFNIQPENSENVNINDSEQLPELPAKPGPKWSCLDVKSLVLPEGWVVCNTLNEKEKRVVYINDKMVIEKTLTFTDNNFPTISIEDKEYEYVPRPAELNLEQAQKILNKVHTLRVCSGTGNQNKKFSVVCQAGIEKGKRCKECRAEIERLRKMEARRAKLRERQKVKAAKHKQRKQTLKRSKLNLLRKVQQYKRQVELAIKECEKKAEEVIDAAIALLPKPQQEAVKACFQAAKRKGPSGIRYTAEWVYECLLMRIKDKKLFNHIRQHKILPLPCNSTMNGYLKNYSGGYGFQIQTLEMMKIKASDMKEIDKHGVILVDEMKLIEGVHFDSSMLRYGGLVDMGEENTDSLGESFAEAVTAARKKLPQDPNQQAKVKRREKANEQRQNKRDKNLGDHALVITFQPFKGKWVQAIGAFLTRSNATDDQLTKLVLEAVILLERSGYYVDGVVTDGAKWNRGMWTKFGIDRDNPSSEHPCDSDRRLWFLSDFPHLVKCMRNCFCGKKVLNTPNGQIKWQHWKAVLRADTIRQVGLRECPKLTEDHLNPNPWQKMNVKMAWQFWSSSVAAAMHSFKFQGSDELDDCEESAKFCLLVNNLADAMNSNRPQNAMTLNSAHTKAIEDFLLYFISLKEWSDKKLKIKLVAGEKARVEGLRKEGKRPKEKTEKELEQEDFIFSESTDHGLIVTLKGSLQLVNYLINTVKFKYVMTARFNQDALERFFGLVRQSCGGNTHPEPRVFAQLFRLLSIYSLVKPPKGSNITGGDMVTSLLNIQDLKTKRVEERRKALSDKLDEIINLGEDLDDIPEIMEHVDHDYLCEGVDEFALSYIGGYVARHSTKYARKDCEFCQKCLKKTSQEHTDVDMLITLKSKGWLTYAADSLIKLLRCLENTVVRGSLHNEMEENLLFVILAKLENVAVPKIGCHAHENELTKSVMKFYLIMRMHFLAKRWNEKTQHLKKKHKGYRKSAHLT